MKANEVRGALSRLSRLEGALPVVERVEHIDARLEGIAKEQQGLTGPLPKPEAAAAIAGWIRAKRGRFERGETSGFDLSALDAVRQVSREPRHGQGGIRLADDRHAFDFLLWILGPRLEELAVEAVERLEYREGAGSEERRERKGALEAERAELVAERRVAVEEAQAAGVEIAQLPETQAQLDREAAQRRRDEEAAAQQREVAKSANPRHEAARIGRSEYLSGLGR